MTTIAERWEQLRTRIAAAARGAGRAPEEIRLVAVSKTVTADQVRLAYAAGQRIFGENRAQEFSAKTSALSDLDIEWHFIGHLQSNKVRLVLPGAALIHSVDSGALAGKISRRVGGDPIQSILVQVNTTDESTKSGVLPAELPALLDELAALPNLRVEGLMTIGPLTEDTQRIRGAFRGLRQALETERGRGRPGAPMQQLSMGMSGDLEIAIEEGATIVRVGTALFGERLHI
jgi:pyridoxal phosphate enzyme (YggS family)